MMVLTIFLLSQILGGDVSGIVVSAPPSSKVIHAINTARCNSVSLLTLE